MIILFFMVIGLCICLGIAGILLHKSYVERAIMAKAIIEFRKVSAYQVEDLAQKDYAESILEELCN